MPLETPPLDGLLRSALRGRAATVVPPADPWPGVQRRARTLRRRRAGAALAGSALAVLAVVGSAGLLLQPGRSDGPGPAQQPTPGATASTSASPQPSTPSPSASPSASPSPAPSPASPSPSPTPTPTLVPGDPYALDPARPWGFRGDRRALDPAVADRVGAAWRRAHPATSTLTPLVAQTYEPSQQLEVVVLTRESGGGLRWGVVSTSAGSTTLLADEPFSPGSRALLAALPGDEVDRLLVVAAPGVDRLLYDPDGVGPVGSAVTMATPLPGVGLGPLEAADPSADVVVGLHGDQQLFRLPAPDSHRGGPSAPGRPLDRPANVLAWPTRGTAADPAALLAARELVASQHPGSSVRDVRAVVLVAGSDAGRRYLLGQFWVADDTQAETVGIVLAAGPSGRDELQLLRPLTAQAHLAVLALSPAPGAGAARLVVVPQPGTGQVLYVVGGRATPAEMPSALDGVALVDRSDAAARGQVVDRLRLLDGDGRQTVDTAVDATLCGATGCG
jgi:hypothetical protein